MWKFRKHNEDIGKIEIEKLTKGQIIDSTLLPEVTTSIQILANA